MSVKDTDNSEKLNQPETELSVNDKENYSNSDQTVRKPLNQKTGKSSSSSSRLARQAAKAEAARVKIEFANREAELMKRKAELQAESILQNAEIEAKLKCLKVEEEYEVENVKMQTLLEYDELYSKSSVSQSEVHQRTKAFVKEQNLILNQINHRPALESGTQGWRTPGPVSEQPYVPFMPQTPTLYPQTTETPYKPKRVYVSKDNEGETKNTHLFQPFTQNRMYTHQESVGIDNVYSGPPQNTSVPPTSAPQGTYRRTSEPQNTYTFVPTTSAPQNTLTSVPPTNARQDTYRGMSATQNTYTFVPTTSAPQNTYTSVPPTNAPQDTYRGMSAQDTYKGKDSGVAALDISKYLLKRDLITNRLLKFTDQPEFYMSWRNSFKDVMLEIDPSPAEELDMLVKWLGPMSSKQAMSIKSSFANDAARGLNQLWERLDSFYGSPERIENALKYKLNNFTYKNKAKLFELLTY